MKKILVILALSLAFPASAFAGKKLDEHGCKYEYKHRHRIYECYRGPFAGKTFKNQSEMLREMKKRKHHGKAESRQGIVKSKETRYGKKSF